MVRDNRTKTYLFTNAGSLTSDAKGNFDTYSSHPVNGELLAVGIGTNDWTATGSVVALVSGVYASVLGAVRGTTVGDTATVKVPALNTGAASTLTEIHPAMNDVLHIVGSGLGAGKSGLSLRIVYR